MSRGDSGFIRPGYDGLEVPDAPTVGTATAGGEEVSVTFTAPSDEGGSAITGYGVVAVDGSGNSIAATGSSSPITVTGLTNGTSYTAKVWAINAYGPSEYSDASGSFTPEMQPGDAFEGGYYAGQISTTGNGVATHYLVVAPKSSGQSNGIQWKTTIGSDGTTSRIDGPGNTTTLSSATYPAANFCANLSIGGYSDWYMPARDELEILYYNLKPGTSSNATSNNSNTYAVPSRPSDYTSGTPAQTSATDFRSGNSEALTDGYYFWSSTESNNDAWDIYFINGTQTAQFIKTSSTPNVRAVRRVAV